MSELKKNIPTEEVAGNGLLHRRVFLGQGAALIGAAGFNLLTARPGLAQPTAGIPPWMEAPGAGMSGYGARAAHESHIQRNPVSAPGTTGRLSKMTNVQYILCPSVDNTSQ